MLTTSWSSWGWDELHPSLADVPCTRRSQSWSCRSLFLSHTAIDAKSSAIQIFQISLFAYHHTLAHSSGDSSLLLRFSVYGCRSIRQPRFCLYLFLISKSPIGTMLSFSFVTIVTLYLSCLLPNVLLALPTARYDHTLATLPAHDRSNHAQEKGDTKPYTHRLHRRGLAGAVCT